MKNRNRKRRFVAKVESMEERFLLSVAPRFVVKDLGIATSIGGINSFGQVVATTDHQPSVSTNGEQPSQITRSPYSQGYGAAINDSGNVAASIATGYSDNFVWLYKAGEPSNTIYGVTGINGSVTPITPFWTDNDHYFAGHAHSINNSNVVVGDQRYSYPQGNPIHAFFYDGSLHDINQQGWDSSQALAINNSNQIVGWFHSTDFPQTGKQHAFFYDGTAHDLGTLGGDSSTAYGINDSGQVVGDSMTPDGVLHAFLSDPNGGAIHDIGSLVGSTHDTAFSVNSQGHVVGNAAMADGSHHGFFFDGGAIVDLNSVTPQNPGFIISEAYGINNSDQIAAGGWDSTGYHALLLTPVPPTPVAPTITWSNPADIVYGTPLSATQLNATASVPGTFTYSIAEGTVLHAGAAQTLTATFTPDDTTDYTTATATVSINVLKAPLTVTANNVQVHYGFQIPPLTGTITGLVNGDTDVATYTTTAVQGSGAAYYAIVPHLTDPNYNITYVNGILLIYWSIPPGW